MASAPARSRSSSANDPLRPFVPRLAADWLRESPNALARTFEGTLVFADVSGFTELTEKLATQLAAQARATALVTIASKAFATFLKINAPAAPTPPAPTSPAGGGGA